MSKLLFKLNSVPDDEANEIRSILLSEHIPYYETFAGTFGIGVAAIWLDDDSDYNRAKHLIDEYQRDHLNQALQEKYESIENGDNETFLKKIKREPIKILVYLAAVLLVLYISLFPFLELGF